MSIMQAWRRAINIKKFSISVEAGPTTIDGLVEVKFSAISKRNCFGEYIAYFDPLLTEDNFDMFSSACVRQLKKVLITLENQKQEERKDGREEARHQGACKDRPVQARRGNGAP